MNKKNSLTVDELMNVMCDACEFLHDKEVNADNFAQYAESIVVARVIAKLLLDSGAYLDDDDRQLCEYIVEVTNEGVNEMTKILKTEGF